MMEVTNNIGKIAGTLLHFINASDDGQKHIAHIAHSAHIV